LVAQEQGPIKVEGPGEDDFWGSPTYTCARYRAYASKNLVRRYYCNDSCVKVPLLFSGNPREAVLAVSVYDGYRYPSNSPLPKGSILTPRKRLLVTCDLSFPVLNLNETLEEIFKRKCEETVTTSLNGRKIHLGLGLNGGRSSQSNRIYQDHKPDYARGTFREGEQVGHYTGSIYQLLLPGVPITSATAKNLDYLADTLGEIRRAVEGGR
jgi:hypothetical protein